MSMRIVKGLALAAALLLPLVTPAAAQDRLVIAGRDAAFGQALARMVELYRAKNPSVTIERMELAGGPLYDRLVVNAREGSRAIDVAMLDDIWAPEFMGRGWLADIDALGGVPGDFVPSTLAVSRHPTGTGKLFAVPFVGNVAMFAYRRDLFEAQGLPRPATWTDARAAAQKIAAANPGTAGVVFRGVKGNPIVTGFLPILWAHGGEIVGADGRAALDTPAGLAALEMFLSLKPLAPTGVEAYNATELRDAMEKGRAAIAIEMWPGWAGTLDDPARSTVPGKIEVVAAPGQTAAPAPMLGTWLLAIPADSPNKTRALDFIRFVTAPENQKLIALETGNPPTRESVYTDAAVVAKYRWYPAQLEALKAAKPRPRIAQWARVETILGDYLQLALIGEMPAAKALAEAHKAIDAALPR